MTAVFLEIAGMSLTACAVIAAVLVLRLLLKKAPKMFSYLLWTAVFFRLLCPFSVETPAAVVTPVIIETVEMPDYEYNPKVPDIADMRGSTVTIYTSESEEAPAYRKMAWVMDILAFVWLAGAAAMLSYGTASWLKLKARLKDSVQTEGYFSAENIDNPFIMGIIKPKIYLPQKLGERETEFILMHENAHIRRGDHIAKFVMFLALCLHWFNPLVWLSFRLCERDMEMSCDEGVTKDMSPESKADYGQTLLNLTAKRTAAFTACFGESGTKQRVKNVLSYKKPALWIIIACAVLAAAAVLILASSRKETDADSVFGAINCSAKGQFEIEIGDNIAYYNISEDTDNICNEFVNAVLSAEITEHGRSVLASKDKSVDFNFYWLDCFTLSSGRNAQGEEAFEITCQNIKIMDEKFFEISREDFQRIYTLAEKMVFYPELKTEPLKWTDDSFVCNKITGAWKNEPFKEYSPKYTEKLLNILHSTEYRRIETDSNLSADPMGELRFYYGDGQSYDNYCAVEPFTYEDENSRVIYGINILSTNSYHYYEIPHDDYTGIFSVMYNSAFDEPDETEASSVSEAPGEMKIPPVISIDGMEILPGACQITQLNPDGTATTMNADAVHPLDSNATLPKLVLDGNEAAVQLECAVKPDRIALTGWDASHLGNPDAQGEETGYGSSDTIILYTDRIYKLTLYWEDSFLNERSFCGYTDYIFATA